jgi:hypothetical protein
MPVAQALHPSHHQALMHESSHFRNGALQRGRSDTYAGLLPEARKSNLLRGASADLSEFIWPQDQWPQVPYNDFHMAQELPTVDLAALPLEREATAQLLVKTFSEWGFVQVVNHGVPSAVTDRMQSEARKFFDLPLEQKQKGVAPTSSKYEGFGYGVESGFFYAGKPWIDRFQCRWSPVCEIREPVEKVFTQPSDAELFRSPSIAQSISEHCPIFTSNIVA